MKITSNHLLEALKVTAPAVLSRPQVPVQAAVHLLADFGSQAVTFSTTDYETWISSTWPANQPGRDSGTLEVLVAHRTLAAIAKVAKGDVDLEVEGSRLVVRAGRSEWSAPVITAEMPRPPMSASEFGRIEADVLRAMVQTAAMAAGTDRGLPALLPVNLSSDDDYLRATCTDRYRVHAVEQPFERTSNQVVRCLPDAKALAAIVGQLEGTLSLGTSADGGLLGLSNETTTVLTRMLDVSAVDMRPMMITAARDKKATTHVAPGDLAEAVRSVRPAIEHGGGVLLRITADSITVTAHDDETGAATTEVDHLGHDGPGIAVRVNDEYLIEGLLAVGGDQVDIDWQHPYKPALMTGAGRPVHCLLMPVRDAAAGWAGEVDES